MSLRLPAPNTNRKPGDEGFLDTRSNRPEILDSSSSVSRADLTGNLRDIRRANRYFGGTAPVVHVVSRLARHLEQCKLLDIATGSADIPLALLERAGRADLDLRIVATDLQPEILAVARSAERPGNLWIEQADAQSLPYEPDAFDIATLSLALHHFDPGEAVDVLAEMRRVAGYALVVSDLERSWPGYAGAWLFGNLMTRNRLTRHDAPLSVRRAYTQPEALSLADAAGWRHVRVKSVFPFRFIMVGRP